MRLLSTYSWLRDRGLPYVLGFVILLLTFVNVEQARTIRAQRALIVDLVQDSLELNARKIYERDAQRGR